MHYEDFNNDDSDDFDAGFWEEEEEVDLKDLESRVTDLEGEYLSLKHRVGGVEKEVLEIQNRFSVIEALTRSIRENLEKQSLLIEDITDRVMTDRVNKKEEKK